jgi:hypothetical protein
MDRVTLVILLINTFLLLAGAGTHWYERTQTGTAEWSRPAPPSPVDPYRSLRSARLPTA